MIDWPLSSSPFRISRLHHCSGKLRRHRSIWPPWRTTLLGFANPTAGGSRDVDLPTAQNVAALPAAEREIRQAGSLSGGRTQLLFGAQAKKEALLGTSLQMPVLHLATHAYADPEEPARSYILFAAARPNQGFDYLFLKEAANLNLRQVNLVVASACETEGGKLMPGEGIESFGRAFLEADAKTVLTTLWRVNDRSTADLIDLFYQEMAQENPLATPWQKRSDNSFTKRLAHIRPTGPPWS